MTGQTISHYRILEKLGEGGMGVVYKAEDTKLGRFVALKFLHSTEHAPRLLREAQAAASLLHPNICTVFEVDSEQGFLAMELVDGLSLRQKIQERPLKLDEALRLALGIGDGLCAAHAKGIVHRDIKPGNVLLGPGGQPKITDFGLALLSGRTRLTKTAATIGTPGYMAPEQARGEMVDHRADIWSLGVVLYEMVSGRMPFSGDSEAAVVHAVLYFQPEPLTAIRSGLPLGLDRVLEKCLAKDPADRYQHVDDLLVDLRRLSVPSSCVEPYRRPWRGRLTLVAVGIGLALAGLFWYRQGRRNRIDSLAILPIVGAALNADTGYLTDGITDALITHLSRLPGVKVKSRDSVARYKGEDSSAQTAGRELGVAAVVKGRLLQRGDAVSVSVELIDTRDGTVLWRERYDRPLREILAVQTEITREISERLRPKLTGEEHGRIAKSQTENTEAYQLYLMGRYRWNRRTEDTLRSSAEYFQQAIEKDPSFARAWAGLADAHNLLGTYGVAPPAQTFPRARTAASRALELDPDLAEAHAAMGWVKSQYEWDWAGAEREFQKAIELNPEYATAHHWYAWYLATVGRPAEAVASIRRARDLDPVSPVIHSRVGLFLYFDRRPEEALAECKKSIEMDPTFAWGHNSLGSVYIQAGRYADGIAELEKALDLSHRGVIELSYLGHAYAVGGRPADARKLLAELKGLSARRYVPAMYPAVIHAGLGEQSAAFAWLEKAYGEKSLQSWYLPDPRLDPLRASPHFQDLLRRMDLAAPVHGAPGATPPVSR